MRRLTALAALLATVLLGGCAADGPPLAGFNGGQWAVVSYYNRHAWEKGASCTSPEMRVTGWRVLDQTPERTIVEVRYHFHDRSVDDGDRLVSRCSDWGVRQFTLVPTGDGRAVVRAMTGPQRPR